MNKIIEKVPNVMGIALIQLTFLNIDFIWCNNIQSVSPKKKKCKQLSNSVIELLSSTKINRNINTPFIKEPIKNQKKNVTKFLLDKYI